MTKMPDVVKKAISKQELFCVATSTSKGIPNVAYIKYLKVVYWFSVNWTNAFYD